MRNVLVGRVYVCLCFEEGGCFQSRLFPILVTDADADAGDGVDSDRCYNFDGLCVERIMSDEMNHGIVMIFAATYVIPGVAHLRVGDLFLSVRRLASPYLPSSAPRPRSLCPQ